ASALFYSTEFSAEVEPGITGASNKPAHYLQVSGDGEDFVSLLTNAAAELAVAATTAEDDCFWLYSSGSTGRPKGAIHRHRDMVVSSQKYGCETLGVNQSDTCFSAAKLFFAYGLGNGMTFPLWSGATAILYDQRPTPASTFSVIEEFKPTLYFGVPTLYAAQLQEMASNKPDLSSLRACVSAGEALPADILRRWKQQSGLDILDGIGSTEALHIFVSNRLDNIQAGSTGVPVPGYQAKIIDDEGKLVTPGESGQLLIRGDSTARCYWKNPQKTAETMLEDGWLNTGDTYIQNEEGYFQYCGRNDDMLKIGGIWCSPF
ncbi:MAG: benzoate-CoA ligase family protein, partial [Gammaproteobacteria bacterium]|nr:benzoate-CoA ligase family protein [Gammaproteobacteria bacterium]